MRILIDASAATTSGGGRSRLRELSRSLPVLAPQHEYIFAVRPPNVAAVYDLAPSARIITPPSRATGDVARLAWEHGVMPLLAHRMGVDAVIAPFNVAPTVWPQPRPRLVVIVSNLCPYTDVVCDLYRGRARLRLRTIRWLTDRTLRAADRVLLLSEQAYSLISSELLGEKSEIIPMAPPVVDTASGSRPWPSSRPYFLVAADLMRYKGIELIPRALQRIDEPRRPDVLVCGRPVEPDYVHQVKTEAAQRGVQDRIHLLGSRPHDEVLALMRGARGCLSPSRFEAPGRVPIEAMAIGTPVVASRVPSSQEDCGDAAVYFELDDVRDLSAQLERLLDDDALRAQLVARGHSRLASMHATDATARILRALEDGSRASSDG